MPKRRSPSRQPGPDWHLAEWLQTLRVRQADVTRLTGWAPATVSDIYHGRTEYYRAIVNTLATVLNVQPFELLMHPDEAMALRRLKNDAMRIAADQRLPYNREQAVDRQAG